MNDLPPDVIGEIKIWFHDNGAMSIRGPVQNRDQLMAVMDQVLSEMRSHGDPRKSIVVPNRDLVA